MAYSELQIQDILHEVVTHLKSVKRPRWMKEFLTYDDKLPEYYPDYNRRVKMMEDIKVHASQGSFPWSIFIEAHPRMTPKEFDFLAKTWKLTTGPVFEDFLNTVMRIYHDSNYNINYKESGEGTLAEYLQEDVPVWGSLEGFMMSIVPNVKMIDANGIIAVKPYNIPTVMVTGDDGNEFLIYDDSRKFDPLPVYYTTKQIVSEIQGTYYMVELEEKSLVDDGGTMKKMGYVYEFYDDENIYKITQTGKFTDYKFSIDLYWNHGWGRVLAEKTKGKPEPCGESVTYVSPFYMAVPLLDLATINQTLLQAVVYRVGYPHTIQLGKPCHFEHTDAKGVMSTCNEGYVYEQGIKIFCPACHGYGSTDRLSPLGKMLLNPEKDNLDIGAKAETESRQKALEFVEPGTDNPRFVSELIDKYQNQARKILHLTTTSDNATANSPTLATTEILNAKAMNAFLKPISFQLFSIWEFLANAIGYIRDGIYYESPEFSYPVNYDLYTETEYLQQIEMAKKANLSPFFIHTLTRQFLESMHYNEAGRARVMNLLIETDRLWTFSKSETENLLSKGLAEKWEVVLFDSGINFIMDLERENPKFFEQDFVKQQLQLIDKAKAKASEIDKAQLAKNNTQGALRVQSILGQSTPVPNGQGVAA